MEMEDQERALLEAESEEEETLEAESTEGALSISRAGRNLLQNRDLSEAESDQINSREMGKYLLEVERMQVAERERAVPEPDMENPGIIPHLGVALIPQHTPRTLRQAAELDGMEMEIEALGAEMLAAGSDEEEAPREERNLALRNLIAGMDQRRAQLRARWRPNFDREVEEMHASIEREVEERRRRDREDEMRRDREYEEESNNELRLHRIEHDDAYASYIFTDVESANEVSSRVLCGNCQGTGLVVDALWVHSRTRSAVCSLCDGSGNIMR